MSIIHKTKGHWDSVISENELIQKIIEHLELKKDAKILDVPCGEGKRTEFISSLGYEAVGIDEDMDKIRHGVLVYTGLELYQHDMQDIFYVHYFNLVLVLNFASVFHRKPNENGYILKNLFSCLALNGYLVLGIQGNGTGHSGIDTLVYETFGASPEVETISLKDMDSELKIIKKIPHLTGS